MTWADSWREAGQELSRSWREAGQELSRSWREAGQELSRSWREAGQELSRSWREAGQELVSQRVQMFAVWVRTWGRLSEREHTLAPQVATPGTLRVRWAKFAIFLYGDCKCMKILHLHIL
jgi:hypothetical protein